MKLSTFWRKKVREESLNSQEVSWEDVCLPEKDLTEYLQSLIGKSYVTKNNHILTIKGYINSSDKQRRKRYVMECSICSEDKELWYKGSMLTDKNRLDRGVFPCGDSDKIKYTEKQRSVLLTRYLSKNRYKLLSPKDGEGYYTVRCTVCYKKDPILWYDGVIKINDYKIYYDGGPSCGCCKQAPWTSEQYNILINRECLARGYILKAKCPKLSAYSKITLYNPLTGNIWSPAIRYFLAGGGDRLEYLNKLPENKRYKDSVHIEQFLQTGVFPEGYTFKRNTDRPDYRGTYNYWDCTCPICSDDEYVKAGVCSGVFTTLTGSLKDGKLPCRCAKNYRYTYKEAQFLAKKTCEYYGGDFIDFVDEIYRGVDMVSMKWKRPDGEVVISNLKDVRLGKTGLNSYGFDATKPAHFYIVRWYGCGVSYLKCGITNRETLDRIKEQDRVSTCLDYEILYDFYHESGSLVQDLERIYKKLLPVGVCPKEYLPSGYTETTHDTQGNLETILSLVKTYLN